MVLAAVALLAGAAAALVACLLAGRRPVAGSGWPRAVGLAPLAALVLLAGDRWFGGAVGLALTATGYALLTGFAAANWRRPGMVLIGVGLLTNVAVIAADGGMPVRYQPPGVALGHHHHGLSSRDHLAGLADIVPVPALGETVSPGDLLIGAGGALAVFFSLAPDPRRDGRDREEPAVGRDRPARRA